MNSPFQSILIKFSDRLDFFQNFTYGSKFKKNEKPFKIKKSKPRENSICSQNSNLKHTIWEGPPLLSYSGSSLIYILLFSHSNRNPGNNYLNLHSTNKQTKKKTRSIKSNPITQMARKMLSKQLSDRWKAKQISHNKEKKFRNSQGKKMQMRFKSKIKRTTTSRIVFCSSGVATANSRGGRSGRKLGLCGGGGLDVWIYRERLLCFGRSFGRRPVSVASSGSHDSSSSEEARHLPKIKNTALDLARRREGK